MESEGKKNCAVFSGVLDTKLNKENSQVTRVGFAATRTQIPMDLQDVSDFDHLEIKLKADARNYIVNLGPETFFHDDLYQVSLGRRWICSFTTGLR